MAKRSRPPELEPIRLTVLRHLDDAKLFLDQRRWPSAVASSYNALEECGKYAVKAGWATDQNVDTGAEAHRNKADVVAHLMMKAEASAAAAYTLITSYPYDAGTGLNPLAGVSSRIASAEAEIDKRGLWTVYEKQKAKRSSAPARLRQIPSMRQVAIYSRWKHGRWISPDEIITENLARSVYADALRIATKMRLLDK